MPNFNKSQIEIRKRLRKKTDWQPYQILLTEQDLERSMNAGLAYLNIVFNEQQLRALAVNAERVSRQAILKIDASIWLGLTDEKNRGE